MKHARYINEEFQVNVNVTLGYRTSEGAQRTKRYEKRHPWKPSLFIKSDASMSLICCALAHRRKFRRNFFIRMPQLNVINYVTLEFWLNWLLLQYYKMLIIYVKECFL